MYLTSLMKARLVNSTPSKLYLVVSMVTSPTALEIKLSNG